MPVGTQATVKTVDPTELRDVGSQMILANTYHLAQRPGAGVIDRHGGLHGFMQWKGPILTDSGGFQIWSLAQTGRRRGLVALDDDGATFTSHLDGQRWRFTPESAIELQSQLGADVIMALDECTAKDASETEAHRAAERTFRWARRCRDQWLSLQDVRRGSGKTSQALFGIIQGGSSYEARRTSAQQILSLDLPGVAIGGESIGYSKQQTGTILEWIGDLLPVDRPCYAMGVGDPADFGPVVERGVDLFDSVLPTRLARNGTLMTRDGRLRVTAAACRDDERPIDSTCGCQACAGYTRAYLHHLFRAKELLGHRLATIHNLSHCLEVAAEIRLALRAGTFRDLRHRWANWGTEKNLNLR
jgi:queuine tRNA-ribosyltransferase